MKPNSRHSLLLLATLTMIGSAGAADLGSLGDLAGGMDVSSLASGSAGNAAGVVEYCIRNNYLGAGASGMKDQLMAKVIGDSDKADYADGAKGLLKTDDGKSVDIGKLGAMKKSVTKKACASVLEHAKSLL